MRSSPRSRYSCLMSRKRTSWPWRAASSAMPWPISPAPITAIFIEPRPPPRMVRAELKVWPLKREALYARAPCLRWHGGPPPGRRDRHRDRRCSRRAVRRRPGSPRAKRRLQSPERIRPRRRVGVLPGNRPGAGDREEGRPHDAADESAPGIVASFSLEDFRDDDERHDDCSDGRDDDPCGLEEVRHATADKEPAHTRLRASRATPLTPHGPSEAADAVQ